MKRRKAVSDVPSRRRAKPHRGQAASVAHRAVFLDDIPTNWGDPLLTGPKGVLGPFPWGCPDIERLLNAIRAKAVRVRPHPMPKRRGAP
jgi:hypothetical protein